MKKQGPPAGTSRPWRSLAPLLLLLLSCLTFVQTLGYGFCFDDRKLVLRRQGDYRAEGVAARIFTAPFWGVAPDRRHIYYRPLTTLSYYLNFRWFGLDAWGYHAFNMAAHTANVILIFFLLRLLAQGYSLPFYTAALFAVHPVHTASVAWISGRTDVLALLFSLLTSITFVLAVRASRMGLLLAAATGLALGAGLLCKETAACLLVLLPAIYWLCLRPLAGALPAARRASLIRAGAAYGACLLGLVFYLLLRRHALGALTGLGDVSPGRVLAAAPRAMLYYAQVAFVPGRYFLYPRVEAPPGLGSLAALGSWLVLLLAVSGCVFRRQKLALLACLLWVSSTLPTALLFLPHAFVNEHWAYFPSLAGCLVLAGVLSWPGIHLGPGRVPVAHLLGLPLVLVFFLVSVGRNPVFTDEITLFADALAKRPDVIGLYINLSAAHQEKGQRRRAQELLERAARIDPDSPGLQYNLGVYAATEGRLTEAVGHFRREASRHPDQLSAHIGLLHAAALLNDEATTLASLTRAYRAAGKLPVLASREINAIAVEVHSARLLPLALRIWKEMLVHDPGCADCYISLGSVHAHRGEYEQAIGYWELFIARFPHQNPEVHRWLADVKQKARLPR